MPSDNASLTRGDLPAGLRLSLIVARARNGVIGQGDRLPWAIPEEMAHFKATTMGHALLLGRKTWASIGRPLPGRRCIVLSRQPETGMAGAEQAANLHDALALAAAPGDAFPEPAGEVFVAGGAQLYAQTLPAATRVVLTEVALEPAGDVRFDWTPAAPWRCASRTARQSRTGIHYEIQDWRLD